MNLALPYLILSALAVVGLVASMILPETLHVPLPETVEDADNIGKEAPFWSFLPHKPSSSTQVGEGEQYRRRKSVF